MIAYTNDISEGWSTPVAINNPSTRSAGGDVAIGPEGQVYVCWAGVTESSPFKEILVGFAVSTDGGQNWNVDESAFEVHGITGVLPEKGNIRVNGLPRIAVDTTDGENKGSVYIITGEKDLFPAGADPDIVMRKSTDQGATWTDGIRINQDGINNGKIQYFPAIHLDRFGGVNVLFYDDRNTTSDSTGVMLARSKDGGSSWKEFQISDHNFKPLPIGGLGQGYQGDNIDLTSTHDRMWPVWMDNSTGIYQIWTAPIKFENINNNSENPNFGQNFLSVKSSPNPFTSKVTFCFQIQAKGKTTLEIFDLNGNKIHEVFNQVLNLGEITLTYTLDQLFGQQPVDSGIYIYKLTNYGKWASWKMVFKK
jgi:hypothetical protein